MIFCDWHQKAHTGKHPNIDLLLKVQDEDLVYTMKPLAK